MKARRKKSHGGRAYADGGGKHADMAADKKLIRKEIGKIAGGKGKPRLDKRADGGRVTPFAPSAAKHPMAFGAK